MRTLYIYLSWAGWIWSVIAWSYLATKLLKGRPVRFVPGFPVIVISDKTVTTEAKKPQ